MSNIVRVHVEGGVIQDIFVPKGVTVIVYDYDTDGAEQIALSPNGEECIKTVWTHEEDQTDVNS